MSDRRSFLGKFAARFILALKGSGPSTKRVDDVRFTAYVSKNRLQLHFLSLLVVLETLGSLAYQYLVLSPAVHPDQIYLVHAFKDPMWPGIILRIAFVLVMLSAVAVFWIVYDKYVAIFHPELVWWAAKTMVWLAIAFAMLAAICAAVLPNQIYLAIGVGSFLCAAIFSFLHAGFLLHQDDQLATGVQSVPTTLIEETNTGWSVTNLVFCLSLASVTYVMHLQRALLAREAALLSIQPATGTQAADALFYVLATMIITQLSALLAAGFRSGTFKRYHEYKEEVAKFNERHLEDPGTSQGHGSTTSASRSVPDKPLTEANTQSSESSGDFGIDQVGASRIPMPVSSITTSKATPVLALLETSRFIQSGCAAAIILFASGELLYSLAAFLFFVYSYLFNDFCDHPRDAHCHPDRAIPSGRLTPKMVGLASLYLFLLGSAVAAFLSSDYIAPLGIAYAASTLYSFGLKRVAPAVATPIWCAVVTLVAVYPLGLPLLYSLAIFSIFLARELLLDYRDRQADVKFAKSPSIAMLLGRGTFVASGSLLALGATVAAYGGSTVIATGAFTALVFLVASSWSLARKTLDSTSESQRLGYITFGLQFLYPLLIFA